MKFFAVWDRLLARLEEERFYLVLISVLAVVTMLGVIPFALTLHRNFLTIACDTAAFHSAIVNTLHGNWFRDTAYDGPNYLGLHSVLILLLIAPLYMAFPSVDTLFVLQVIGIYSMAIPFYLVAVQLLKQPWLAFICAVAGMGSSLFLHMAVSPFHPESWIVGLVLWTYYFYLRQMAKPFWISFVLALACGEQAAFIFFALGVSLGWADDGNAWRKRYAVYLLAGSLGWLVLTMGVLIPLMRVPEQQNLVAHHYSDWGVTSISGLAENIVQDLFKALLMLVQPVRWECLFGMVGLPLALAFFQRRSFLLLLPLPIYFLMNVQEFGLYFHAYYFQFAIFAGYLGLLLFLQRWPVTSRVGLVVLLATIVIQVSLLLSVTALYAARAIMKEEALNAKVHEVFAQIPAEAAVFSPHRYSAYLSSHPNMVMGDVSEDDFDFDKKLEALYPTTNVHPGQIDFIFCDLQNDQCGWRGAGLHPEKAQKRIDAMNHLVESGAWKVYWNDSDVMVLERIRAGASSVPK